MLLPNTTVAGVARQAVQTHEAIARLTRKLRTLKLPDGLTHERLSTLGAVIANNPISMSQLAAIEGVRVATMSRMVSGLEELGLVRRQADTKDARGVLVAPTAKGKRAYDRAVVRTFEQVLSTIGDLDEGQLAAVRALLKDCP
jgi:DNA-binding MarR family transcriptional regulator